MHLHCQLAVEMNPEIADCGLGSNCMVAGIGAGLSIGFQHGIVIYSRTLVFVYMV